MPTLTWENVESSAKSIFDVWIDAPELGWAHTAWDALEKLDLTKFESDVEKQIVIIRLFVLGTLYHEFCHFAFDEYGEVEYIHWVDELSDELYISSIRLGQVVGFNYRNTEAIMNEDDNEQFTIETVESLVEHQREIVAQALISGFGNESMLFASLWLSPNSAEIEDDETPIETLDEVLNYPTAAKMQAFEWINSGMPSIQTYRNYHPLEAKNIETKPIKTNCDKVRELIDAGETSQVEFKVGLCYNPHTRKKDDSMIVNVIKAISAFINSNGGKLLIGVDDKTKQIVGINNEYSIVNPQKNNRDGFELFLLDILRTRIDYALILSACKIEICEIDKKDVCEIIVLKSPLLADFAYVENKIFVRQHNRTVELTDKELVAHMRSRYEKAG